MQKKEKIKAEISSETFEMINAYCAWANIDDISFLLKKRLVLFLQKIVTGNSTENQLKSVLKLPRLNLL
ncbi:hypothetical protein [Legionella tunisiensis]|uniref:hypothetical protein n=1 Tax=Legionella tunisiensis TaxID=1034944 RepID=UPI001E44D58A|nr:hypothetical protein [Legionella tunisiensis]